MKTLTAFSNPQLKIFNFQFSIFNRRFTKWASALLLFLVGCQHPGPRFDPHAKFTMPATPGLPLETVAQTNRINPDWLKPPPELFTLGPGDKLEIDLLDDA